MWAEKGHEPRDALFLLNYDLNDIDYDTLKRYRQHFQARQPEHSYNSLDDKEFLRKLGGWKRDRNTKEEGLTLAGLLMFGDGTSIKEHLTHYHLDYIEREEADKSSRYVDRITLDGSWSGNLYDFYLKVYRKLTTDIKTRFNLESDTRKDTTPVHEAIREALVNTLAHADFACHKSIIVVKRPDMFGFRNPGLMRIPINKAIEGGESDCRNSSIHDMFRMVGLSERLGSGINSIFSNWSSQHWQLPKLYELTETEQTLLELRMIDLVSPEIITKLTQLFGGNFHELAELDRTILITAATEKWVNHERVMQLTLKHSREVTLALPRLERLGYLQSTGAHKEKFYTLLGSKVSTVDEIFSGVESANDIFGASSEYKETTSEGMEVSSEGKRSNSGKRDAVGRLLLDDVGYPFIDDLNALDTTFRLELEALAYKAKSSRRLGKEDMQKIILSVCSEHYVSRPVLSALLERSSDALRQSYLTQMTREGALSYAFPQQPTHEKQGYISSEILSQSKGENQQ
jgi:predicted HTH transcriptional regulator